MKRAAAVAGQFYRGSASGLKNQVQGLLLKGAQKERALGVVSPHAGLMYSGHVAGAVYSSIEFPRTFLLLGPNHTGLGAKVAIMDSGEWEVPTGTLTIDEALSSAITRRLPVVSPDIEAHRFEHSLEVQLPFIAFFSEDAKIVPITVMMMSREECELVGKAVADSIREVGYEIVIVASSDMSHYVPDDTARRLDGLALDEILRLSPEGLYSVVKKERITMCGVIPVTIMLYAVRELGAKEARLVRYATSGEISGDYEHVVGYAGVTIK